jgi:hypothetical protein
MAIHQEATEAARIAADWQPIVGDCYIRLLH